jgi:hypothetical protein
LLTLKQKSVSSAAPGPDASRSPWVFRAAETDLAAVVAFIHDQKKQAESLTGGRRAVDVADLYHEFSELRPQVVHTWLDWDNVRGGLAAALAGVPRV